MLENRPVRVVQFLNGTVRFGAEEVALKLLQGLDSQKFCSYLVCPDALLKAFGADVPKACLSAPMMLENLSHWREAWQFIRFLRREQIDVVHAHMIRAALVAVPLARLAGVPVVVHTCHVREAWRTRWMTRRFWLDRRISAMADMTIAVSESTRDYLIKEKQIPPSAVKVIRNGRASQNLVCSPVAQQRLRSEFAIEPDELVIGVFGRLEPQKGHAFLLEALRSVRNRVRVKVLLVGEGSLRQQLAAEAERLGVSDILVFTGYRFDATQLMDGCDLVVLPSLFEGMPLVPIEAAALGKAIVATAVDGTCEVVVQGATGLLVPPRDPAALSTGIIELLLDQPRRVAMGERARKRAQASFSLQRQLQETEQLYLSLLDLRQARRRALKQARQPNLAKA